MMSVRPVYLGFGYLLAATCLAACASDPPAPLGPPPHPTTVAIDRLPIGPRGSYDQPEGKKFAEIRQALIEARWVAVQRAVAYQALAHRDAFYGSRAYWHTGSERGLGWALDHPADLAEPFYVAGRGNVRIKGDANADIEVAGNAIVHIFGNLNATLELKGVCEVVIAGDLTKDATIICDGQLELFVAGDTAGVFGATQSATIIIDGDAGGAIQCGSPATGLTVTGDLSAEVAAPADKNAVLNLRVDGYAPTAAMLDLATAGFTRVNATLGQSNVPPGLYPENKSATRPVARWVVLKQRDTQSTPTP